MECSCYLGNVHDKMVDGKRTACPFWIVGRIRSDHRERQVKNSQVWTENTEKVGYS